MVRKCPGVAVAGFLLMGGLSGCSWFTHDSADDAPGRLRNIDVDISASPAVNPNASGLAQPVKVCVMEISRAGWVPEGIGEGAPCRDEPLKDGLLSRNQSILQPNETRRFRFRVPAEQERWIVVGAEFQQSSGVLPLAEKRSPAQADSHLRVVVGMTSLSVVTNDKMDE